MLRHRSRVALAALVASLVVSVALVGTVVAHGNGIAKRGHSRALVAHLTGAAEVPGPGDPDGRAVAVLKRVSQSGDDKVCWLIVGKRFDLPATAAHIHGPATTTQPANPVVTFAGFELKRMGNPNGGGVAFARGCTTAPDSLLDSIWANPRSYYVNVHNAPFPNGAVRGQLR